MRLRSMKPILSSSVQRGRHENGLMLQPLGSLVGGADEATLEQAEHAQLHPVEANLTGQRVLLRDRGLLPAGAVGIFVADFFHAQVSENSSEPVFERLMVTPWPLAWRTSASTISLSPFLARSNSTAAGWLSW